MDRGKAGAKGHCIDGYYWALHSEGTIFIALCENGKWYLPGLHDPVNFDEIDLIGPVRRP